MTFKSSNMSPTSPHTRPEIKKAIARPLLYATCIFEKLRSRAKTTNETDAIVFENSPQIPPLFILKYKKQPVVVAQMHKPKIRIYNCIVFPSLFKIII